MSFVVIKLGGCNGSGKTSVARELLKMMQVAGTKPRGCGKHAAFYQGLGDLSHVYVLGSYVNVCGGMDTISDKHDRFALVASTARKGRIIFFEGLITGKTYGALGEMSEEHVKKRGAAWLYAFMDTPFDVCVERVLKRRAEAGNANPFDPERTMRPTFDSCESLAAKLRQEKTGRSGPLFPHPVHMVDHRQRPATAARALLRRAQEMFDAR